MEGIINAMIGICNPFDLFMLDKILEEHLFGLVPRKMGTNVIEIFKEHFSELRAWEKYVGPLEACAERLKTVRDFDTAFTIKIYGYDTVQNYYRKASCVVSLNTIKIPCFFLSASDDMVVRYFDDFINTFLIALR